ncbi:MAG TPA: hypothetical protein VFB13_17500 [Reyranella sp.]|jgi:hypothetical protein|nr:hypothetical protein [Reyranella sp.]
MDFSVVSAGCTRALEMSKGDEKPNGYRSIRFSLRRKRFGGTWLRLRSGGELLGSHAWSIDLNMSEIEKDCPWKGIASVHRKTRPDDNEDFDLLAIALRVSREEMDECWSALMRGMVPKTIDIDLREEAPQVGWSMTHPYDHEWNDIDHRDVEVESASIHYEPEIKHVPAGTTVAKPLWEKWPPYIVGLLAAILVVLLVKR